MSSKQSDFYKSYMETLQKKAKEAVSKAQEKTFEEYFEVADTKIRDIYKKTIIDFYQDYTPPRFYDRRGSLFNLIQTKRGSDYLSIWFDPSKISYRNGYAGEDGLYETVFRQGRRQTGAAGAERRRGFLCGGCAADPRHRPPAGVRSREPRPASQRRA